VLSIPHIINTLLLAFTRDDSKVLLAQEPSTKPTIELFTSSGVNLATIEVRSSSSSPSSPLLSVFIGYIALQFVMLSFF